MKRLNSIIESEFTTSKNDLWLYSGISIDNPYSVSATINLTVLEILINSNY